jgi:peroxiredoxin
MPKWVRIRVVDTSDRPSKSGRSPSAEAQPARVIRLGLGQVVGFVVLVLLLAGALLGGYWLVKGRARADAVAIVNGQPISQQELDAEIALFTTMSTLVQGRPPDRSISPYDMLNQLIADRLKYQAALSAGITVTDAEVEAQIRAIEAQAGFTEAELQTALAAAGLDRRVLAEWLRRQLTISRYVNSVLLQGVPPEAQENAVRNWTNTLQTQADIEIRLGSGTRTTAKVGEPAPDFTLLTPEGGSISLSELRGQAVVINFWATWCPPCRLEMPMLEAAYQKYQAQGLTVLAVDQQEAPAAVRAYFQELGLSFPVVIDETGEVSSLYRVLALPTSYFVDREGVVRAMHRGLLTEQQLEGYIAQVLGQ